MADTRPVWTLKGVTLETREAVKIAARKRGLTIAAWVEETCRRVATEEIKGSATLPGPTQDQVLARVLKLVEGQAARLAALEATANQPPPQPSAAERRGWLSRLFSRA